MEIFLKYILISFIGITLAGCNFGDDAARKKLRGYWLFEGCYEKGEKFTPLDKNDGDYMEFAWYMKITNFTMTHYNLNLGEPHNGSIYF